MNELEFTPVRAATNFPPRFELDYWDGIYRINTDASDEETLAVEVFVAKGDWLGGYGSGPVSASGWYHTMTISPKTLAGWINRRTCPKMYPGQARRLAAPPEDVPSFGLDEDLRWEARKALRSRPADHICGIRADGSPCCVPEEPVVADEVLDAQQHLQDMGIEIAPDEIARIQRENAERWDR
tara:strand:- start:2686 stop:3234 length:549 start_codon:yes stop_codon:yes gene_type:complete